MMSVRSSYTSRKPSLIALLVPKGTGPGVYTMTDAFGTEAVPKLDLRFWRSSNIGSDWERIDGTVSRSRVKNKKAYPSRFLDRIRLEPVQRV